MIEKRNVSKFLSIVICSLLGVSSAFAAWDGTTKIRPKQDANKVFLITNEAELAWLSDTTNSGNQGYNVNVKLMANLDMAGKYFVPICGGGGDKLFTGVFDGNNHIISNLKINGEKIGEEKNDPRYGQNVALIGVLGGGTVKNLVVENVDVQSTTNIGIVGSTNQISVGAIVGWIKSGTIENCSAFGSIITSGNGQGVGGIVGNMHSGTLSNCLSSVEIRASGKDVQVGGLVGLTKDNAVTVRSSVYEGAILESTGSGHVGGIVGQQLGDSPLVIECSYYDSDAVKVGVGEKNSEDTKDGSIGVSEVNVEQNMCALNGGKWTPPSGGQNGSCSIEGEIWFTGDSAVSLEGYGADGYMVTFNANEGVFPANAKKRKFVEKDKLITSSEITNPSRNGYAFAGWALTQDAKEPAKDLGKVNKVDTIYAVWKNIFTVTLDANPGKFPDGKEEKTVQVVDGEIVSMNHLELPFMYNEGEEKYYFMGWADKVNASESEVLDPLPTITGAKTLHAVWSKAVFYTVSFNDNGHGKVKVDFTRVEDGKTISVPADPVSNDGYSFGGWFTESACQNKFDFEKTAISENRILYAKWTKENYTITYNLDGGTNNAKNPSSYNVDTETFAFETPVKDGYDFKGWYYDENLNDKATQVTKGTTGNKILYAKWEPKKYLIYYLAGSDAYGTLSPDTLVYGKSIKLKGNGYFRREDHKQVGWVTADGKKEFDFDAEYAEKASITLFPKWKVLAYTITYVLNGGINNSANVDHYADEDVEGGKVIELKNAMWCGRKFAGWYTNEKFTGNKVTKIESGTSGDLKFYAKWNSSLGELKKFGAIKIYMDNGVKCAAMESDSKARVDISSDYGDIGFVTYNREFPVNKKPEDRKYSTLVLPFTIAKNKVVGAEFYEFVGVSNVDNKKSVQITPLSGDKIIANKPYILRTTKANLTFNLGENETVVLNTSKMNNVVSSDGQWQFRGMYETKEWKENDSELGYAYGYTGKTTAKFTVGKFARNAAGAYIYPFRAYLLFTPKSKVSAPQKSSPSFLTKSGSVNPVTVDEYELPETMEIEVVYGNQRGNGYTPAFNMLKNVPGQLKILDGWFDMLGRKLKAKPTTKGVYYYNGKRVRIN